MNSPSNLLSPVLAFLTAWASPAAVMGADDHTDKPPMIIQNLDGTFTVQKAPPKEQAKDAAKRD